MSSMQRRIHPSPRARAQSATLLVLLGLLTMSSALTFGACRGPGPSEDPHLAPNSPLPEIERRQEPKPTVPNPFVDGGLMR